MIFIVFLGLATLLGFLVSSRLKSRFKKYGKIPNSSGWTGAQVAQAMLDHYGVSDVKIIPGSGRLTDHYHPIKKVISLSESVYHQRSIAATAVAAHECGHAIQHAQAYRALRLRSVLVPIIKISSTIQQILLIGILFGIGTKILQTNFGMGILATTFGITALFALITLPVEFDASKRALQWLKETGLTQGAENEQAKDALWWAAMTYVAQAISSLVLFLFFFLQLFRRR